MAPPTLLTLPPEIRQQIWEYSLTSPTGTLRFDKDKKRFDVAMIGAGLLSVSHFVAAETYYLPLQLNTLEINMSRDVEYQPELEMLLSRLRSLEQDACCVFNIKYDFDLPRNYLFCLDVGYGDSEIPCCGFLGMTPAELASYGTSSGTNSQWW